jgi:hypothetical protein
MNTTIQQSFYRNGQLREQVPMRNGHRHGVARTWHKNGALATEEPYQNDLLHGICRQWDESGRLLGRYKMTRGTGVQRSWHPTGQIQLEVSTVDGQFCGRNRLWLADGTLISERYYLHGLIVSAHKYREAAATDRMLPRFRGKPANLPPTNLPRQRRIHRVFVASLLAKQNHVEARSWLQKEGPDKTARLLGHFKRESDTRKFVKRLYEAGAVKVIVPDIYRDRDGNEFADCLVVRLGNDAARRKVIRNVCAQLRRRKLGVVQPDEEMGETHLYLSMT